MTEVLSILLDQGIQVVADPVAQGKYAARFEVKYGDVFSYYSDARSLMSGPSTLSENEGNERWYRWQALWPQDWVGSIWKGDFEAGPSSLSGHCSPRGDRERQIGSSVGSAHPPVLALFVLDQRR